VHRLWVLEVPQLGPVPALRGMPFRLARSWHVSDLWLLLYVQQTRASDPDGHSRV
jgi:hypothetical protein